MSKASQSDTGLTGPFIIGSAKIGSAKVGSALVRADSVDALVDGEAHNLFRRVLGELIVADFHLADRFV